MKATIKPALAAALMGALGAAALALRAALYAAALDEKGLLLRGHPLGTLIALTAAAALVITLLAAANREHSQGYPPAIRGIGAFLFSAGIAFSVIAGGFPDAPAALALRLLGLAAALALAWTGIQELKAAPGCFLCRVLVCVYSALYLVARYQIWSANPQIQDYVFSVLGCAALALFAYFHAARLISPRYPRRCLAAGLLAGYFCLGAVYRAQDPLVFLGAALWALTQASTSREVN